ncbi:DUF917 domain-containing protein [Risungbinella massiliensis]|uniref:DUF917 domain-containing protein n=1 Tax=Risungbinella massiliensis TaxID=1329796 RepID=UPI000AA0F239|nr:DUF917 family protein [Risungbinella massiliensis]
MKIKLTAELGKAAVYGGAVLGGGGGGWIQEGLHSVESALQAGTPVLHTIDEFADEDHVVTVSLVGAPAAPEAHVVPEYSVKALQLLEEHYAHPIRGIMTNENGADTTVNGWYQAAVTGKPLLDAPCNGRAHPTGSMGSLNLSEQEGYVSLQAAVGGAREHYVESFYRGSLDACSSLVRQASIAANGLVAVARNPVAISYIKEHAAIGGIQQAIQVGQALLSAKGEKAIQNVLDLLGGQWLASGIVQEAELTTTGGFDVGKVVVDQHEVTFWNEYMTVEYDGERLATFPDLIMTFDLETGMPLISAEIRARQKVALIQVPKEKLLLSSTMSNERLLKSVEPVIQKTIIGVQ